MHQWLACLESRWPPNTWWLYANKNTFFRVVLILCHEKLIKLLFISLHKSHSPVPHTGCVCVTICVMWLCCVLCWLFFLPPHNLNCFRVHLVRAKLGLLWASTHNSNTLEACTSVLACKGFNNKNKAAEGTDLEQNINYIRTNKSSKLIKTN